MRLGTSGDGRINFTVNDGNENEITSNGSLRADTWCHVAAVYDPNNSGELRLYINGELDNSKQGASIALNQTDLKIGLDFFDRAFDGLIREVSIWGVARSQSEISYDMDHELQGNEADLNGYWRLDDNGNHIKDYSQNGNDGIYN